jgi:hypothetical protein
MTGSFATPRDRALSRGHFAEVAPRQQASASGSSSRNHVARHQQLRLSANNDAPRTTLIARAIISLLLRLARFHYYHARIPNAGL